VSDSVQQLKFANHRQLNIHQKCDVMSVNAIAWKWGGVAEVLPELFQLANHFYCNLFVKPIMRYCGKTTTKEFRCEKEAKY